MKNWQNFENRCTNSLNSKYSYLGVNFNLIGGSNSNISDIQILKNGIVKGYIEVKMELAQSGQFVLINDSLHNKFIYSTSNKSPLNQSSQLILNYINSKYNSFKNVSTSSIPLNLPKSIYNNWIIQHYKNKDVSFIITLSPNGEMLLVPINEFGNYFSITANFRRKKSGSRNLPNSDLITVENYLTAKFDNIKIFNQEKKFLLELTNSMNLDKYQFSINSNNYQLSYKNNMLYEIRKLGKTNNPNVIFSIQCIKTSYSNDDFINYINSL